MSVTSRAILLVAGVSVVCTSAFSATMADISWLKGKCPKGAMAWDHGGVKIVELSTGAEKNLGSGSAVEFSTQGSFLGWNAGGKAKVLARKSGQVKELLSGISGHVSWVSDREFVAYAGGWKLVDVITGKISTPDGLSSVQGSAISGEGDVKRTSDGKWVVLVSGKIKSNSSDAKVGAGIPGECSGSLSPQGMSMTGLQHDHKTCKIAPARSGGASKSISWGISCSGKGMDNNRFSSTSQNWIVEQNECASSMGVHEISSNTYALLGSSAKTSGENYGDFSDVGPTLDFGATAIDQLHLSDVISGKDLIQVSDGGLVINARSGQTISIYGVDGTRLVSMQGTQNAPYTLLRSALPRGICIVKISGSSETTVKSLVIR